MSSGEIFTTQTKVRVPAAATVIVALASLVCAIAVLVNLVQSFTGSASTTRTVWTYTFLFASVVGVVILGRLRAFEDRRLIIDTSGMTVVDRRGSRSFPWTTLGSVAILHGGRLSGRSLVIEGPQSVQAALRRSRLSRATRHVSGVLPFAVVIPLRNLDADEAAIVEAIRRFSAGRFPDPDRYLTRRRYPTL